MFSFPIGFFQPLQTNSNTVLLIHGNGSNNGTIITDVFGNSITNSGVITSTTQSKFNGSSLYFNGSSYATTPISTNLHLSSSIFTLESWIYPTSLSGEQIILSSTPDVTNQGYSLALQGNILRFESGGSNPGFNGSGSFTVNINTWNHIAIGKSGNNYYFAVNGNVETIVNNTTWTDGTNLYIGSNARFDYPYYFQGYAAEIRITKGVALYTTSYSVPTVPFPNI